jgi:hypothetical protein
MTATREANSGVAPEGTAPTEDVMHRSAAPEGRSPRRRRVVTILVACLLVALLASGCAGGGDDDSSGASDAAASEEASAGEPSGGIDLASASLVGEGREVVSTAQLDLTADDVAATTDEVAATITGLGGHVFAETSDFGDDVRATMTLKVPPEEFRNALDRLGELGERQHLDVSSDDVTEAVIDLASRIETAEASVERLRGFLAETGSVEQIATLEQQLVARETELERLLAEQRVLEARVAESTIVVTLTETAAAAVSSTPGFLGGLEGGWAAFVNTLGVVLTVAGAVLPFAAVAAVGWLGLRGARRLRGRTAPAAG